MNRIARISTAALTTLVLTAGGTVTAFASEAGSHSRGADDATTSSLTVTSPPAVSTVTLDDRGTDRLITSVDDRGTDRLITSVDDRGTDVGATTSVTAKAASKAKAKRAAKSKRTGRRPGAHHALGHGTAHR